MNTFKPTKFLSLVLVAGVWTQVQAQEYTEVQPEMKRYEIAQGIEPTPNGLAKEMSDQAEVIAEQEKRIEEVAEHSASVGRGLVETRDQVARITAELRDRNQKLLERVEMLEKKITHIVNILKLQKENNK